jgi:chromosome segregation ATPase
MALVNKQTKINRKIGVHKGQACAFVSANVFLMQLGTEAYQRNEMDTAIQIRKQIAQYEESIQHHQDNLDRLHTELEECNSQFASNEEIKAAILHLEEDKDYLPNLWEGICDAVSSKDLTIKQAMSMARGDKVVVAWFKLNKTNEWDRAYKSWMNELETHLIRKESYETTDN